MKTNYKLLIVTTYKVPKIRSDFITVIPKQIKDILDSDVKTFFCYIGEVNKNKLHKNNIKTVRFNCGNKFSKIKYMFYLNQLVRKIKPNAVINMVAHKDSYLYALPCRLNGVRSIARVAGNVYYNHNFLFIYRRIKEFISLLLVNKIVCLSNHLVSVTPAKFFSRKVSILSPGLNLSNFNFEKEINNSRDIDLVFVGRFEEVKNLKLAFQIFETLSLKRKKNLNFSLVGDGSLLNGFRQKYKDNKRIKFYGNLPHNQVFEVIKKSKFLILTSHSEGFGKTIIEAMLFGSIPILTKISDFGEIIKKNKLGILIDEKNYFNAVRKILDLMDNKIKRKKISLKAYNYLKKNHDTQILRKYYKKIFFEN